jgi:ABC-type antimicrobial peptide transport system permease subunit
MVAAGIAIGLGLAALLTRFLGTLLFGIAPIDPLTFAADTAVLVLVGAIASLAAARRALALDPAVVMRRD